jgi:hypothetical protein
MFVEFKKLGIFILFHLSTANNSRFTKFTILQHENFSTVGNFIVPLLNYAQTCTTQYYSSSLKISHLSFSSQLFISFSSVTSATSNYDLIVEHIAYKCHNVCNSVSRKHDTFCNVYTSRHSSTGTVCRGNSVCF